MNSELFLAEMFLFKLELEIGFPGWYTCMRETPNQIGSLLSLFLFLFLLVLLYRSGQPKLLRKEITLVLWSELKNNLDFGNEHVAIKRTKGKVNNKQ